MTQPCTIQGKHFPSQTAAAKHFGVCSSMIGHVLAGRRDEWKLGAGSLANLVANRKPVSIGGQDYISQVEAAKALGVSANEVTGYLRVKAAIAKASQ